MKKFLIIFSLMGVYSTYLFGQNIDLRSAYSIVDLNGKLSIEKNHFEDLEFLIGKWQGVETGIPGNGIGFRTYDYDLNNNYIIEYNKSVFPKSKDKPIGEVHRDFGVISYNSNTSTVVLRQFHVEGFTNIFELSKKLSSKKKLVFITREIENNPGKWKARTMIEKISKREFIETFEIATDGKNYKPYLKNHWHKIR